MLERRLYKSRRNVMVDGVCAGIADYFGIDPTLVRIGWVVLSFAYGGGILAYIVAGLIIPAEPEYSEYDSNEAYGAYGDSGMYGDSGAYGENGRY